MSILIFHYNICGTGGGLKENQMWKAEQAGTKLDLKSPKVWKITDYVGH